MAVDSIKSVVQKIGPQFRFPWEFTHTFKLFNVILFTIAYGAYIFRINLVGYLS